MRIRFYLRPCSIRKCGSLSPGSPRLYLYAKPIGGTAGHKRLRLIEERACNEKTISSKVKFLKDAAHEEPQSAPAPELLVPEAVVPSSSNDDFEVYTPVAADGRPD